MSTVGGTGTGLNPERQILYKLSSYDARGNLISTTRPDVQKAVGDTGAAASSAQAVHSQVYNAFGEVTEKRLTDSVRPGGETYAYTDYDRSGQAWRSVDNNGVLSVNLYDVFGNQTGQLKDSSTSGTGLARGGSVDSAQKAMTRADLVRTYTRYNLLGQAVQHSPSQMSQVQVLQQDSAGQWQKVALNGQSAEADAMLVVEELSSVGANPNLEVLYRVQGSNAWQDATPRLQMHENFRVLSCAAMASGNYEVQIRVSGQVREQFSFRIDAQQSARKTDTLLRLSSLLLGRLPLAVELAGWLQKASAGIDMATIADEMYLSEACQSVLGGLDDRGGEVAGRVSKIFKNVFGRDGLNAADSSYAADTARWHNLLSGLSREERGGGVLWLMNETLKNQAGDAAQVAARARLNNLGEIAKIYSVDYRGGSVQAASTLFARALQDVATARTEATNLGKAELFSTQIASLNPATALMLRKDLLLRQAIDLRIGTIQQGGEGVIKVTAEGSVGGQIFFDTNQTARPVAQANPAKETLIADIVAPGKPNANMANAHAEVGVIQQAYDANLTKGADMAIVIRGKEPICSYCSSDVWNMAQRAGLNSLKFIDTKANVT